MSLVLMDYMLIPEPITSLRGMWSSDWSDLSHVITPGTGGGVNSTRCTWTGGGRRRGKSIISCLEMRKWMLENRMTSAHSNQPSTKHSNQPSTKHSTSREVVWVYVCLLTILSRISNLLLLKTSSCLSALAVALHGSRPALTWSNIHDTWTWLCRNSLHTKLST